MLKISYVKLLISVEQISDFFTRNYVITFLDVQTAFCEGILSLSTTRLQAYSLDDEEICKMSYFM